MIAMLLLVGPKTTLSFVPTEEAPFSKNQRVRGWVLLRRVHDRRARSEGDEDTATPSPSSSSPAHSHRLEASSSFSAFLHHYDHYYDERYPLRRRASSAARTAPHNPQQPTNTEPENRDYCYYHHNDSCTNGVLPDFPATLDALTDEAARAVVRAGPTHRIGLQLEGTSHLVLRRPARRASGRRESAALRHVALVLAGKLSQPLYWTENRTTTATATTVVSHHPKSEPLLPIAMYWNTVQQAQVASRELLYLQAAAAATGTSSVYDRIQIRCLTGDHPMIPSDMLLLRDESVAKERRRRQGQRHKSSVTTAAAEAPRGLILVVQPTDNCHNDDHAPTPDAWTNLQKLVAAAAVEDLPVVALVAPPEPHFDRANPMLPWVLRDFTPPVFSWMVVPVRGEEDDEEDYSHHRHPHHCLALFQSQPREEWHVFAQPRQPGDQNNYMYLASCRQRPTAQRMRHLVREHVL